MPNSYGRVRRPRSTCANTCNASRCRSSTPRAELWFDSVADKDAFYSDPDYLRDVNPDEARFADMSETVFFVTSEEPVIDRT